MSRPQGTLAYDPPRRVARSLRGYRREYLPKDLVAGALVVAIAIPISMGMAEVAGVPPVVGLYSCVLPLVAYAFLGSSRQLVVALDASTAAMLAAAVTPLAGGDPARQIALASLTAILVGGVLVLAGVFRAGVVAALLSHPVLLGYQAGLAVVVAATQLPRLLGIDVSADTTLGQYEEIVRSLGDTDWPTFLLGAACLVGIALASRRWPRVPGPLIAIVAATGLVELLGGAFGDVAVVGSLPAGWPPLGMPDVSLADARLLLPAAFAIALIASADTIVTSRAFAERGGYEVDASTDMVGVGAANAASGFSGGITISASAARTAVVELVGGRSQVAGLAAAALMALILLFFTSPLESLPLAALGAVVLVAVARLVDVAGFRTLWRIDRGELAVGVLTAVTAIGLGLLQGIGIGALLSLGVLFVRVRPRSLVAVVRATVTSERRDGVTIARPLAPVVYLNATRVLDQLRRAVAGASGALVLDASAITNLDATGALALVAFATDVERNDVDVVVAGVSGRVDAVLARAGFWRGPEAIDRADDVDEAIALALVLASH
jgi:high affinity sulfate transporter 1